VRWLGAFSRRVGARLDGLWWRRRPEADRLGPRIGYERVEEVPDRLEPSTLYVAGEGPWPWAGAMLCPCGCRDVIELNLLEQASPSWNIRQNRDGTITLTPSIWRTKGCGSHFLVRNSRIVWCQLKNGLPTG